VPFAPVLVPERSIDEPRDAFSTWAEGRQQSISADNAIVANIHPASMNTSGLDSFTYFPMLGLPAMGPGLSSTYSSLGPGSTLSTYPATLICQCLRWA
jgi:hypothetical protein